MTLRLDNGAWIKVSGTTISSNLKESGEDEYNHAVDGVESLLLSLHSKGVDISTPEVKEAIQETLEHLSNNI